MHLITIYNLHSQDRHGGRISEENVFSGVSISSVAVACTVKCTLGHVTYKARFNTVFHKIKDMLVSLKLWTPKPLVRVYH